MAEEIKDKEQGKKEGEKPKKERPTNCAVCNKAFKHKIWYYKNSRYFCNKRCWEKFNAEIKAKAAEAKAKEEAAAAEAKAKEADSVPLQGNSPEKPSA